MQHRDGRDRWLPKALVLVCALLAGPASAADDVLQRLLEEPAEWFPVARPGYSRPVVSLLTNPNPGPRRGKHRLRLDVTPFATEIIGWFRHAGIPLQEERHPQRDETIGVSACLHFGEALPALTLWISERSRETLGAFYSPRAGMSWALVWPVDRFTLRLEGGDDSEFGYFAVLGVQWRHPSRPLAVGIGIPMQLHDSDGDLGAIVQLRMILD